jgi:hypothetical protein
MMNDQQPHEVWLPLLEEFREDVNAYSEVIDPGAEYDWHDLTLGWALAKGLSPNRDQPTGAAAFARYVRYHTDMA